MRIHSQMATHMYRSHLFKHLLLYKFGFAWTELIEINGKGVIAQCVWTNAMTAFSIHLYRDHATFKKLSGYHVDRHHVYRPKTWREVTFRNEQRWSYLWTFWNSVSWRPHFTDTSGKVYLFLKNRSILKLINWEKNIIDKNNRFS